MRARGRGRPIKDGAKNNQYRIRLSDEELDKLNYLSFETDKSKADVIRDALKMYYNVKIYDD